MTSGSRTPLWYRLLKGMAYMMLCAFAVCVGIGWSWIGKGSITTELTKQTIFQTQPTEVFKGDDALTLLILGCDEDRYYGGKVVLDTAARSDMMMIAKLDFEKKKITGLSIPRDTVVDMPGFRPMRINAFHALGKVPHEEAVKMSKAAKKALANQRGCEYSKQAVEFLLGVQVDRVVQLNYEAFQAMIDMVGGIEVFVDKTLKYTDRRGGLFIDLKPGRQTLNGYDAMCFARYRHGDSDFHRQDRQKQILMSFKETLSHKPGLMGPVTDKLQEVFGGALNAPELAAVALFAQKIGNDNIKMGQVPVIEMERYDLALDREKIGKTLRDFNFAEASLAFNSGQ